MNTNLCARTWLSHSLKGQVCPSDVICAWRTAWRSEFRRRWGALSFAEAHKAFADSLIEAENPPTTPDEIAKALSGFVQQRF